MKVKARKLLSLLLTLAMVAGMFVLPASAAEKQEMCFCYAATGDAPSNNKTFFTLTQAGKSDDKDGKSVACPVCGTVAKRVQTIASKQSVAFTAPSSGTATFYTRSNAAVAVDGLTGGTVTPVETSSGSGIFKATFETTADTTYTVKKSGSEFQIYHITWEPSSTTPSFVSNVAVTGIPAGSETPNNTPTVFIRDEGTTVAMIAEVTGGDSKTVKSWAVKDSDGQDCSARGVTIAAGENNTATVTVSKDAVRGKYTITAVSTDAGQSDNQANGVEGTATLVVNRPVLTALSFVTADQTGLKMGDADVALETKATWAENNADDCIVKPSDTADRVEWKSNDTSVVTVDTGDVNNDGKGVLHVVGVGSTTVTATSVRNGESGTPLTATLNVTVSKGDKTLTLSEPRNKQMVAAGGYLLFKLEGLPDNAQKQPYEYVSVSPDTGVTVAAPAVGDTPYADESKGETGWNVKVTLPANGEATDKEYTVSAAYTDASNDLWNVTGTPSQQVKVLGSASKNIRINVQSGSGSAVTITSGADLVLKVDAVVKDASGNDTTDAITFKWMHGSNEVTADGTSITITSGTCQAEGHVGHTESTLTIKGAKTTNAGAYTCVATAQDDANLTVTSSPITVVVNKKNGTVPTADVDAATRKLTNVKTGWKYSLDGSGETAHWQNIDGAEVTIPETIEGVTMTAVEGIYIQDPGDAETLPATQHIVLERATTPVLVSGDGTLTVTTSHKAAYKDLYQVKGGSYADWTDVTVTETEGGANAVISGLQNGTEYQVRVKYGKYILGTITPATGTPAEPAGDPEALKTLIQTAKNKVIGVWYSADGADVVKGDKWVSKADGATYNAAIKAAEAVANAKDADGNLSSTATELTTAMTTLQAAMDAFDALEKKAGTKKPDAFVLNVRLLDLMEVEHGQEKAGLGTVDPRTGKGYFTIVGNRTDKAADKKAKVQAGDALFEDGFYGSRRLNTEGKVEVSKNVTYKAVKITTQVAGATVKVWVRNGGNASSKVKDRSFGTTDKSVQSKTVGVEQTDILTVNLTAAGTYYLGGIEDTLHIYRMEVVEPGVDPYPPTKEALNEAITAAGKLDTTLATSTDGSDVDQGKQWVTEKMKSDLATALAAAEAVAAKADATQDEIDDATAALETAIEAYKPADGKKLATTVAALQTAVTAAEAKKVGVETSADGKDIDPEKTWVTPAVMKALDDAITAAKAVIAKGDGVATEAEITAAANTLKTASDAFVPAEGIKADEPVKYAVTVTGGTADKATAAKGESVKITAAAPATGKVFDKWTATGITLSAADAAKAELTFTMPENAVSFTATYKDATVTPPEPEKVDMANLNAAIASATDAKDGIVINTTAANVDKGALWVTADEMKALDDAIAAAKAVAAKTDAKQADVDAAVKTLNAAVDAFVTAVKEGEKAATEGPVEVTKTLESKVMTTFSKGGKADGEEEKIADYFTIIHSTQSAVEDRGEANKKTWDDGYESQQRLNFGGKLTKSKNSIKFETTGAATVKVWWVAAAEGRQIAIIDNAAGSTVEGATIKTNEAAVKDSPYYSELAIPAAGTYYLGGTGGNYIFKVQVVETKAGGDVPVEDEANKTALKKAVSDAEAAVAAAKVSVDGSDISTSDKWVSQADVDALNIAIKTANLVVRNAKAEQAKVDDATAKLNAAIATFRAAEQAGTKTNGGSSSSGGGSMVPASGSGTTVTKKDGTKTETVTKPDGSSTVSVTDEKGIKTETATTASGDTSVKVTLPKHIDKTTVTIPVKDATEGTVAVIVKADGTEQIVKTAIATAEGISLTVDGNVTLKVKDNAKEFIDVEKDYWAKGAVDFVSSREIFKGTTEVTFSPLDTVNRAMMATVLYRLSDAKAEGTNAFADVAAGTWYTEAVVWANRAGVVNGYTDGSFGPVDAVTREQMAAMLFRYAKAMDMDVSAKGDMSKFSDVNDVASWASEAMTWCVGVGLINGVGDPALGTILAPAKTASRAEVAAIMQRMVKLMMQ